MNEKPPICKRIKAFFRKLYECCPLPSRIIFAVGIVAAILLTLFKLSPDFADFYNRYPGALLRALLATLTGWLPFSLAETGIMMLPIIVVLLIIKIRQVSKGTLRQMVRMTLSMLSGLVFFLSTLTLVFSAGYYGSPLEDKLGFDRQKISAEDLEETAKRLIAELEPLVPEIEYQYSGASVMPYSFSELNGKIQNAYAVLSEEHSFIPSFRSRVKPIVLSKPMTYTHLAGVYTYFTGESNINTNFPDYTLPFTVAHELAHQRGLAREEEANFIAFLVCQKSEDPYVRYSGNMAILEYVLNALYRADVTRYNELVPQMELSLRYEMAAYNEFFEEYRDSTAANISGVINDTYLQLQGQTAGIRSYGLVVDLTVAYYKTLPKEVS